MKRKKEVSPYTYFSQCARFSFTVLEKEGRRKHRSSTSCLYSLSSLEYLQPQPSLHSRSLNEKVVNLRKSREGYMMRSGGKRRREKCCGYIIISRNPFPPPGNPQKRKQKDRKRQRRFRTPRRQCPLNQQDQCVCEFTETQAACAGLTSACTTWSPGAAGRSGHLAPSLTQKLAPGDNKLQILFSPQESHWRNKLLLRVDPCPAANSQQKTNSMPSVGIL